MPELPEVETVRRSLLPKLVGLRITDVHIRNRQLREPVPSRKLRRHARGRRIDDIVRRAKYLRILLDNNRCLLVHLGMSGRLQLMEKSAPLQKHVHVIFDLEHDMQLRFNDPRRFGIVDIVPSDSLSSDRRFRHLGPEPLSDECSAQYFHGRSRGLRKPVKNFLMDARQVVGVGNIYASEALFRARIHPQRAAGRIGLASWGRLTSSIKQVLTDAIQQGGTTLNDFQDGNGNVGYFRVSLQVYGKKGEPCSRCGRALKSTVLAGRSTFYCAGCQR